MLSKCDWLIQKVFAEKDCLKDNICAAIRVLVMAERHQRGVLTLTMVMEPEGRKKTKRWGLVNNNKKELRAY